MNLGVDIVERVSQERCPQRISDLSALLTLLRGCSEKVCFGEEAVACRLQINVHYSGFEIGTYYEALPLIFRKYFASISVFAQDGFLGSGSIFSCSVIDRTHHHIGGEHEKNLFGYSGCHGDC